MSEHDHNPNDQHLAPGDAPLVDGKVWDDPHHEHHNGHGHDDHHVHVIPFRTMFITFIALLMLTALTVWTSRMYFGEMIDLYIALAIATVKATLVCAFFMHLKYEKPLNTIVLCSTLLGIVLFIGLSMLDLDSRGWDERRERGEIYTGGRLELNAGQLPPFELKPGAEPRPKAAMNIVELARQHAEQMAANEHLGKHSSDDAHGSDDGHDHAPQGNEHEEPGA